MFPRLVCSIYEKFVSGDLTGSLEEQYRLMPIRLAMDKASFPVGTKDLANVMGLDTGVPYRPNLPTGGPVLEIMRNAVAQSGIAEISG